MTTNRTFSNQTLTLTPTASSNAKDIMITGSSSIMKNYEPSRSVTASHKIRPVEDINGNPIIFSIGTNNHLFVIIRDPKSKSGWSQYDVTGFLGDGWNVEVFQTLRYDNNTFVLAVSLVKNQVVRMFVTKPLSTDPTSAFWSNFSPQLVERQNGLNLKSVSALKLGQGSTAGVPVIIADATVDGTNYDRYVVNSDPSVLTNLWSLLPLPQNAHSSDGSNPIVDTAIGKLSDLGLVGTYSLYYVGQDLQLTFDTIDLFNGQILSHAMTVPDGARSLATIVGDSNGNTELYVAGNGLFRFPVTGQGNSDLAIKIADTLAADAQTELEVLSDDQNIAAWILDEGVLTYVHGTKDANPIWTDPMPIAKDIGQIAALRNDTLNTNEIFDVDANNNLNYYYQDPVTSIWRLNPIQLPDTGNAVEFDCYTTCIHFESANGGPVTEDVNVSASSWIYATINGQNHILDVNTKVPVTPDPGGAITIITKVSSASAPLITIDSASFKEVVDVNPQNVVNEQLKNFTDANSVQTAKTQDGQQVMPSGSDITSDQLAQSFTAITSASDAAHGSTLQVRTAGAATGNAVNAQLLSSFSGMKSIGVTNLQSGQATMVSGAAAAALVPSQLASAGANAKSLASGDGGGILAFFGDVWNAITSGLKKVGSWVLHMAEEGLQFIVHLAEGVVTFLLDTIEKIYQALSWVLQQIEMGVEKLISWLGQLLGWDDIITCHNIIANGVNQTLQWLADEPQTLKSYIDDFFNTAAQTLTGHSLPSDITQSNFDNTSSSKQASMSPEAQQNKSFHQSPGGSFAKYHMVHSGPSDSTQSVTNALTQVIKDFMDTVKTVGTDVYNTVKQIFMDIINGIHDGSMSMAQILEKIASDAVLGALQTSKDLFDGILNVASDLVKLVQAVLNYSIEIPFITGLYKLITGDSSFTLLNGISLLVSVPSVILMKLFSGTTPFAKGTLGLDDKTMAPSAYLSLISGGKFGSAAASNRSAGLNVAGLRSESLTANSLAATGGNAVMTPGVLYSQIGGAIFIICEGINFIFAVMSAAGADIPVFGKWIRVLLLAIIAGGTFPAVQDPAFGWRIVKWLLNFGTMTVLYCLAVDPTYGVAGGFFSVLFGLFGLVLAFGIPITVSLSGTTFQIALAWVAFIGSLGVSVANISAGIAKFDPEPDTKAVLVIVAGVGFIVKVVFDIGREITALITDATQDYKPFYA